MLEPRKDTDQELRLSIKDFECILRKAGILTLGEALYEAHVEPGELVIKISKGE